MAINEWWKADANERYWLEVTDRETVGADLQAPETDAAGRENWTYTLVRHVEDGDVVFHYETPHRALTSWSFAAGGWWREETIWAAHGTVSRARTPYRRPGLYHGLHGPFALSTPLTLADFRANTAVLNRVVDGIEARHSGSLYLPFQFRRDELRMGQGYMFKFPRGLIAEFPQLREAGQPLGPDELERPRRRRRHRRAYRRADEDASLAERDPFPVDPSVVERGVRGHARTQNQLADHVAAKGFEPESPGRDDPQYDLLWRDGERLCVAEVKSLTTENEDRQLRLGLGQLLHYRYGLSASGDEVRAYLVCERKPRDAMWDELCRELGIELVWPDVMTERIH